MNIRWRKRVGLVSAMGVIVLLLVVSLQPLAAQDRVSIPGESPAAPVPGAANPEQPAAEDKPTASVGVDVLSQYIWRGFALSRQSAVLQPSVTLGYKGFSVNVWGNFDTSENAPAFLTPRTGAKWNETDFTFGYSREIYKNDFIKALTLNLGGIYYAFDTTLYPQGDSFELYYGLAADFEVFKLAVMGNTEVFHYPGNWLTVGISRVFELPYYKATLELGNNYIFLFSRDYRRLSEHSPLPIRPAPKPFPVLWPGSSMPPSPFRSISTSSVAPKVGFWYGLGGNSTQLLKFGSWDAQQNHVYGGVNVNFAF